MFRSFRTILIVTLVLITVLLGVWLVSGLSFVSRTPMIVGASFDDEYAAYLGLDPQKVFVAMLDQWQFRYVRLSAEWDVVERNRGTFNFKTLDWYVAQAAARHAKITLVVGQKTPRWPECHIPDWASHMPTDDYHQALLTYVAATVQHYRDNPAIEIWQVENEPYFTTFGICPPYSSEWLDEEIALVKKIDPTRPVLVTDSGELSSWQQATRHGDLFGTTLYRVVWNKYIGYWSYNNLVPPAFYRFKLFFTPRNPTTTFISELQAEPWIPNKSISEVSLAEQYRSMSLTQLQSNIDFAKRLGLPRVYLWGAEWWYWLEAHQAPAIASYIASLPKQ